uniref:Uncharacterized protein n=1 Tax=Fervidicoccus fontis TaxID=683846 RepID=A0A7J3ZJJ0_9CREN
MVSNLDDIVKKMVLEARRLYPNATIKEVKVHKSKVVLFGRAGRNWFKAVIYKNGRVFAYSSSQSLEFKLKRVLEVSEQE